MPKKPPVKRSKTLQKSKAHVESVLASIRGEFIRVGAKVGNLGALSPTERAATLNHLRALEKQLLAAEQTQMPKTRASAANAQMTAQMTRAIAKARKRAARAKQQPAKAA